MNNKVICAHCMIEVKKNMAVSEVIDGDEKYFCCTGCRGVYSLVRGSGLGNFYEKRRDWEPGPPGREKIHEDLFRGNISHEDGETVLTFILWGIRCASCIWLVENFLKREEGITGIRINYATHRAVVRWESDKTDLSRIIKVIQDIGYTPLPDDDSLRDHLDSEKKDLFYRFSVGAFFSMQIMMYSVALYAGYFHEIDPFFRRVLQFLTWLLATPVMFYSGAPFLKNSIRSIKNRVLSMDILVFLGSFCAYTYSVAAFFTGHEVYFDTSVMIITLILLGRFLEAGVRVKSGNAVARLRSLQPKYARLLPEFSLKSYSDGEQEVTVKIIDEIIKGEFLEVLPGDLVPVDGSVAAGSSDLDESMLTGEPLPRHRKIGDDVFAGTVNLNGTIVVTATGTGGDTVLSGIADAVEEAQGRKPEIQGRVDRIVAWFVPVIIILALLTLFFRLISGDPFFHAMMNAVSVLVIACPCALGLATPLALVMATGKLAEEGVIVKSGDILEEAVKSGSFCFDKTGTLTTGKPRIIELRAVNTGKYELLQYAASIERFSRHPVAVTITGAFDGKFIPVKDFREFPGKGVSGFINNEQIFAGNLRFLKEKDIKTVTVENDTLGDGSTVVYIAWGGVLQGSIHLADTLKDESIKVLSELAVKYPLWLLSGDTQESVEKFSKDLNIDKLVVKGGLTPDEKASFISGISNLAPAMVGDGINDAPALAVSSLGISMGKGTEIAMESSDAVLVRGNLNGILSLIKISRFSLRIIRQNLFWAFSYNILLIPLAISGMIHPIISASLMSVSSLIVVFNSLRINRIMK